MIHELSDGKVTVLPNRKGIVNEDRRVYVTADEFLFDIYKLAMQRDKSLLLESEIELMLDEAEMQKLQNFYNDKLKNNGRRHT